MSTFTSVVSPVTVARIFIGSLISPPAPAERHLDLLRGDVVLPIGSDQCIDVRRLRHLHPRRDRWLGSRWYVKHGSEHVRVFLDQDGDRVCLWHAAADANGDDRAVLGNFGCL